MATTTTEKSGRRPLRIGRYDIVRHIASGGMGAVYQARDSDAGRDVALKVLPLDAAANPIICQRFLREARTAIQLQHDNIVSVYEFGEAAGTFFLAMEFIDGINLHEYIAQQGRLPADIARGLLKQAAKAIAHVHNQGIVHRDIKPSNFLITEQDDQLVLKLTDLGLARQTGDGDSGVPSAGSTMGTVDYMSPEQARNCNQADVRSDIYSLGCTAYHMLAGYPPFHEGSMIERVTQHVNVPAPNLQTLVADVPIDLACIVERMLRKNPEERYQTMLDVLRDLLNPERFARS